MDTSKYYYFYEKKRNKDNCEEQEQEQQKELMELKERQQKYISESNKKIDDLLLNCEFEAAFEQLVGFLVSIESKDVPYVLAHYYNIINQQNKMKKI
jgi:hypothetical protein